MKCSLGISNFLEEISRLSLYSIVSLYFFALIAEEGFLLSPCYSLELAFKWVYLSFSLFPLASLLFSALCKASSENHFGFLHFFFLGMVLITAPCTMSRTSGPPSIVHQAFCLSDLIPWSVCHFHCIAPKATDSLRPPWTVACQAPLSMELSQQEYWSR